MKRKTSKIWLVIYRQLAVYSKFAMMMFGIVMKMTDDVALVTIIIIISISSSSSSEKWTRDQSKQVFSPLSFNH